MWAWIWTDLLCFVVIIDCKLSLLKHLRKLTCFEINNSVENLLVSKKHLDLIWLYLIWHSSTQCQIKYIAK